ncbi:glycosyltransferase [Flavobacteriaceae bacterium]|nr:glycosyltransferase [Flavobacteriaceae bacterium]|tara:strand:+ start:5874 stop:7052 length:1179 start_codon:yes stop_codon:yes gene_type:complete
MKIGMILDAPFPIDPRVSNEASALISAGHEVYLFCLSYSKKFIKKEVIDSINIRRYYCSKLTYKFSALAYTFPYYKINMSSKINNFLNSNGIDKIHIHDIQIASSVFKANLKSLPVTLDLHENRPEIMKFYKHVNSLLGKLLISPKKWKIAEEKFSKAANNIIVVTNAAKTELCNRIGLNKDKITVFPNTVRKSFYTDFDLDNNIVEKYRDNFVLLYLGNTSKRRGISTVINSLKVLKTKIPEIKFIVVGSSSYDNELKYLSKNNNVQNLISFEGWRNENSFQSYLSICDIGVSPLESNIHHDTTYANKIFQYMSFGCPMICSNVIAQKEIVEKYEVGELFSPGNSKEFTEKVISLYNNKDKINTYSLNSRSAIENHLNNDIVSTEIVKMYG